jgi:hypothetical protein
MYFPQSSDKMPQSGVEISVCLDEITEGFSNSLVHLIPKSKPLVAVRLTDSFAKDDPQSCGKMLQANPKFHFSSRKSWRLLIIILQPISKHKVSQSLQVVSPTGLLRTYLLTKTPQK